MISRKSGFEIERMRKAGEVVARILSQVAKAVTPGITTGELDRIAADAVTALRPPPSKVTMGFQPVCACRSMTRWSTGSRSPATEGG